MYCAKEDLEAVALEYFGTNDPFEARIVVTVGHLNDDSLIVDVPYISQITHGLYMGGCADGLILPPNFTKVISFYPWAKYSMPEGCERVEVAMYDSVDQSLDEHLEMYSTLLEEAMTAITDGGDVLVHCECGLNRSGVFAALYLMKFFTFSAEKAIETIREKRSFAALCNPHFDQWLRNLDIKKL